jgi:hypothetical protein
MSSPQSSEFSTTHLFSPHLPQKQTKKGRAVILSAAKDDSPPVRSREALSPNV